MSLVVSDTSPVRYLVLCGSIEVIPRLFQHLIIPLAVFDELTHEKAPPEVRTWAASLPPWATVQNAGTLDPASNIDLGEREALALALELQADYILLDDRTARRVAGQRGLIVTGTIGVMELAAARGFLDLGEAFHRLSQTNFRAAPGLLQDALTRHAARGQPS